MPTRTKNVEMKYIVTNLEFICITASVNPVALNLEEGATGEINKKGVFKNFTKLTGKHL